MVLQSAYYHPRLPDRVATHFGLSGEANGWASKEVHVGLMLLAGGVVVAMFEGLGWLLSRLPDSSIGLPHRAHWLAEERREETLVVLRASLLVAGGLTMAWLVTLNEIVLRANLDPRPRLGASFWVSLIVFLSLLALWLARLTRRFASPPQER